MTILEKELNADVDPGPGAVGGQEKLTEMFTVKLGLKNSKDGGLDKLGEVREIPLSMQRPRSNSGSRLLTDEVRFVLIHVSYVCSLVSFCVGNTRERAGFKPRHWRKSSIE